MKTKHCPNCNRIREVEEHINISLCPCGELVKFPKLSDLGNFSSKDDEYIIKQVFQRGVRSGKPDAQSIIDSVLNEGIKVNLK